MSSVKTWINLKGIMLCEISQTRTNTVWFHLYLESKTQNKQNRNRLIDTKNKIGGHWAVHVCEVKGIKWYKLLAIEQISYGVYRSV